MRDTRRDATADEVRDLKVENEFLRAKLPERMTVTPVERHRDLRVLYPTSPPLPRARQPLTFWGLQGPQSLQPSNAASTFRAVPPSADQPNVADRAAAKCLTVRVVAMLLHQQGHDRKDARDGGAS